MSALEARRAALNLQSELLERDVEDVELDLTFVKKPNDIDGELETIEVASLAIKYQGESFVIYIDVSGNVWGGGADAWESTFSGSRSVAFGKDAERWSPAHTANVIVLRFPMLHKRRLEQKALFKKYFKK